MGSDVQKKESGLASRIGHLLIAEGADLFGVASPELLSAAPEGFRPQDLLPGCKAVVVYGKRLSDATVESTPSRLFDTMYAATNSFIELLMLKASDALIREGYRAVAVGPHSLDNRLFRGDLSQKHAAVAAGLGRFGLQSLVLTPQFGPRQRWGTVLTDAPLRANAPLKTGLCQPEKCGQACLRSCPARALSERKAEETGPDFLPGGLWYYGNVEKGACRAYRAERKKELDWATAGGHACAVCLKVCPVGNRRTEIAPGQLG